MQMRDRDHACFEIEVARSLHACRKDALRKLMRKLVCALNSETIS
jgi:hypothetical protein